MCLHYLVKHIARILSPYTLHTLRLISSHQVCGLPIVLILTPVDYAIWGITQERVYNKGKIANVEELCQCIVDEWERLDPVSYTHLTLPTNREV